MTLTGTVFQIQRYCIHDGYGIRTTVFFKGCPLRCLWCSNPESQKPDPEMLFRKENCARCGECISVCPNDAVSFNGTDIVRDWNKCTGCGKCAEACIFQASNHVGTEYSVDEILNICRRDVPFYKKSGGGVTLSGGEPFFQHDFALEILKRLKAEDIHTSVETTGFVPLDILMDAQVDCFLFDFKCYDDELHKKYTGVSNELIKNNLSALCASRNVIVRMPLIPAYNTEDSIITDSGRFFKDIGVKCVHLLPYHSLGEGKYDRLGRTYTLLDVVPPDSQQMNHIRDLMSPYVPDTIIM